MTKFETALFSFMFIALTAMLTWAIFAAIEKSISASDYQTEGHAVLLSCPVASTHYHACRVNEGDLCMHDALVIAEYACPAN